jgi:hypothetical protein
MKVIPAGCILLLLFAHCDSAGKKESGTLNYGVLEQAIDSSCALYIMYYLDGAYMYRVGTTDSCNDLTKDQYTSAYDNLLAKNLDEIVVKKGKIIFETDYPFGNDSLFRTKLIAISEKHFSAVAKTIEERTDEFTIALE